MHRRAAQPGYRGDEALVCRKALRKLLALLRPLRKAADEGTD